MASAFKSTQFVNSLEEDDFEDFEVRQDVLRQESLLLLARAGISVQQPKSSRSTIHLRSLGL